MERGVLDLSGGIAGLRQLIRDHREVAEYACITHGLRLRDCPNPAFTWRDLWVIVRHADRTSPLAIEVHGPEEAQWGLPEQLLAAMVDRMSWLVWAKSSDAEKGRNRPQPIPRPGVESESKQLGTASSVEEIMAEFA